MDILYKRGYVEYHGSLNANVYISYLYKLKRGYVTCRRLNYANCDLSHT